MLKKKKVSDTVSKYNSVKRIPIDLIIKYTYLSHPYFLSIVHLSKILDALECAKHYQTSDTSQDFIIKHIVQITSTLTKVNNIKEADKDVTYKALCWLLNIVNSGIKREDFDCTSLLESLAIIFKEGKPDERVKIVKTFHRFGGLDNLSNYLVSRATTPTFPNMKTVMNLLMGSRLSQDLQATKAIADVIMKHILSIDEDATKEINGTKRINSIRINLFQVYLELSKSDINLMNNFLTFIEKWAMKLVVCEDTDLKRFGLAQITAIVTQSPPLSYNVSGAGCIHINGTYDLKIQNNGELWYHLSIPESYEDREWAGKRLTLFRCNMRSRHKWWFISEANEDQPGTDKDIDYYQLKSKHGSDELPSPSGWITCKAGIQPPPTVESIRSEYNSIELANWTIKNGILGLVMELSSNGSSTMSKELISAVVRTNEKGSLKYLTEYLNSDTIEFPPLRMATMLLDIALESMSNNMHSSDACLICKSVMEHFLDLDDESFRLKSNTLLYLSLYATTKHIPLLVRVFGLFQNIPKLDPSRPNDELQVAKDNTKIIIEAVMKHILGLDEDALGSITTESCCELRSQLLLISEIDMSMVSFFFDYWRRFALKLVKSQSIKVRCLGWNEIDGLISESIMRRPPPNTIVVSEAGTSFFNGTYVLDPESIASSEYLKPYAKPKYLRQVPVDDPDIEGSSRTLSIHRHPNIWYLLKGNAHYYEHKTIACNPNLLPTNGWVSSAEVGDNPAPIMKAESLAVPTDEETLEHRLAEWAIKNELIELALGDSAQIEVVPKLEELIKFLAGNCDKDYSTILPSRLSLKASHLVLAQQTLTSISDTMILVQLHMLLVAVYFSLPEGLNEVASPVIKNAVILRIERNDPMLFELQIGDEFDMILQTNNGETCVVAPSEGIDFSRLGQALSGNTNIEIVRFDSTFTIGNQNGSGFFECLKHNISILTLSIAGGDVSETAYIELLQAFKDRATSLMEISIVNCGLDEGKISLITPTIQRCANLKELSLPRNNIEEAVLTELIPAITGLDLATLDLSGNSIGRSACDILAYFLKDECCQLQKLGLSNNQIDDTCISLLAAALTKNNKLEHLNLHDNEAITVNGLNDFVCVLCNTKTINQTYNSNHTLSSIGYDEDDIDDDDDLAYYLDLNRNSNKSRVAMKKIIFNHNHLKMDSFFGWDSKGDRSLKALPFVVNWFDRAEEVDKEDECYLPEMKLDAIYQFAQAMPLLFVSNTFKVTTKKRKRDESGYCVEGCGIIEMNGIYKRRGKSNGVPKYVLHSRYKGKDEEFTLFRCRLMDNTR